MKTPFQGSHPFFLRLALLNELKKKGVFDSGQGIEAVGKPRRILVAKTMPPNLPTANTGLAKSRFSAKLLFSSPSKKGIKGFCF